ncbi:unnamed protein product [Macrosiphum euphorbiae]|uniref:Uncharacterized protein n=1 Tax=Macrosiphum euphorbiae TaxID=13131 RepID=A0AAV0X5T2_9HEMI|nr:unnamed protein product [Macrosiphum euphorbiae]
MESGVLFKTCNDCLISDCHVKDNRPCNDRFSDGDDYKFVCFHCKIEFGNKQFYTKDDCMKGCCTDESKICVCDSWCYMCVSNEGFDQTNYAKCVVDPNEQINCK